MRDKTNIVNRVYLRVHVGLRLAPFPAVYFAGRAQYCQRSTCALV
jgi:hypothetical protein